MIIGLITRDEQLYSSRRLIEAAKSRGHEVVLLDALNCNIFIGHDQTTVRIGENFILKPDAIIPRIGSSITYRGSTLIRQFESIGIYSLTTSEALLKSRDKLTSLQILKANGIDVPASVFGSMNDDFAQNVKLLGGFPILIKAISSTHGEGIEIVRNMDEIEEASSFLTRNNRRYILQEFIQESKGEDIRVFVVGGKVVASMKRKATQNDFRSNLHLGGTAESFEVSEELKNISVKACQALGLQIGGVDIIMSKRGPLVLEVNASPGLEGIEAVSGADVAKSIMVFLENALASWQYSKYTIDK